MRLSETFDKRYLKRVGLTVLTAALALLAIVYVAYHALDRFSPGLELLDARPTTVTKIIETDGYIMRDEKPLYSSVFGSGSVASALQDGGRVAMNAKIADVYSGTAPDAEQRMREIDEQIALLKKSREENRSVQSAVGLEGEIYEGFFALRSRLADGAYADAVSMRTSLLVNIKKRDILTGALTDYSAQIRLLEQEKSELRASLGNLLNTVYASETGYYYTEYDGYGSVFSSELADSMTYSDFVAMTQAAPSFGGGLCVGSLVRDYVWYVACPMAKTEAAAFADMTDCRVSFDYSGTALEMQVHRVISDALGQDAVVLFRCEKLPVGFDFTRMQPVKISAVEYTGYEIPVSAIRVVSGYEGVYVLDEVTIEFRRVHILYEKDGVAICSGKPEEDGAISEEDNVFPWIRQNDVIVLSGTELYSGKVVD